MNMVLILIIILRLLHLAGVVNLLLGLVYDLIDFIFGVFVQSTFWCIEIKMQQRVKKPNNRRDY
ncbi:MAG TPA: hypothetical protein PLG15_06840 [Candidatus Gastranaerophilaceae bacterium]|nr:hypothetical protein [Candidatus Gastranaerophilaceae bacterium]HPT42083.1 hypothetical protein [Candidatus Gastranaerophilaceae bacterium]